MGGFDMVMIMDAAWYWRSVFSNGMEYWALVAKELSS